MDIDALIATLLLAKTFDVMFLRINIVFCACTTKNDAAKYSIFLVEGEMNAR